MCVVLPAEVNGLIQKAWDALEQAEKEAYITMVGSWVVGMVAAFAIGCCQHSLQPA